MTFDATNWLLGALTAIIVGLTGRLLYRAITKRLDDKPNLSWFLLFESEFPYGKGIFDKTIDIVYAAKRGDPEQFNEDTAQSLVNEFQKSRYTSALVLQNSGKATAEKISILLEEEPLLFSVKPKISVQKRETADGHFEFELNSIEAGQRQHIIFFGIHSAFITRVSYLGNQVPEIYRPVLVPYTQPKNTTSILLIGIGIGLILSVGLSVAMRQLDGKNDVSMDQSVQEK